jgi:hypothetical protein
MNTQVSELKDILSSKTGQPELSVDNIDQFVYASNPLSIKVLQLQSKFNGIDDAMQVIKKAYDKDQISLEEHLKLIRQLSKKQARQQIKLNKLLQRDQMDSLMSAVD